MCGICGIFRFSQENVDESIIRTMMNRMKHRGPDDEGIYVNRGVGLGFVRLSILDLSPLGHQPMFDDSERYIIIHNGEVYNFIEIREELIKKGYSFKSNTDTEVILNSYIEWGEECLNKFNGMWAFCIYDTKNEEFFAARDRFGVKPFYYFLNNEMLIFGSEIPVIVESRFYQKETNYQMVYDFLVYNRTDHTNQTFYKSIFRLGHGEKLTIKNNKVKIDIWYNLRNKLTEPLSSIEEFRYIFSESIKLRLRSDVPVGLTLSGGLDSSSILSLLINDFGFSNIHTYSAVYGEGENGDESKFIELFRDKVKNMHFAYPTVDSFLLDYSKFCASQGEPVTTFSQYAGYKVMELAKKTVTVVLNGQGSDEQLAGYDYFYSFYFLGLLKEKSFGKLLRELKYYFSEKDIIQGISILVYLSFPSRLKDLVKQKEKSYLKSVFVQEFSESNRVANSIYGSKNLDESLIDHFEYKLEHLLKWEDRNSMAFSIESRTPFLDYRLVEKTLASPPDFKIFNGKTKYVLRQSLKDIMPPAILNRKDKVGYDTPSESWYKDSRLQNLFIEIINDSNKIRSYVDVNKLLRDIKKNSISSVFIWKIVQLELWENN